MCPIVRVKDDPILHPGTLWKTLERAMGFCEVRTFTRCAQPRGLVQIGLAAGHPNLQADFAAVRLLCFPTEPQGLLALVIVR